MGKGGPEASTLLAWRALPETCHHLQPWPPGIDEVPGYQLLPCVRVGLCLERAACFLLGAFPEGEGWQRDPIIDGALASLFVGDSALL